MAMHEAVYVGLGANLGDAVATLQQALAELAALPGTRLQTVSSFYRTAPVDSSGPDYVNAVAELATTLEPEDLLRALQSIESAHGRLRPYRHAPRTLDLDVLLFGQRHIHTDTLTVPHPRLHERAFVLQPLAEIAPMLAVPGMAMAADLAAAITGQPIEKMR